MYILFIKKYIEAYPSTLLIKTHFYRDTHRDGQTDRQTVREGMRVMERVKERYRDLVRAARLLSDKQSLLFFM